MALKALLQEQLSQTVVIEVLLLLCVLALYRYAVTAEPLPKSVPWEGKDGKWLFADVHASLLAFSKVQEWLTHGYAKYSKQGKSYIKPSFFANSEVILPLSSIKWFLNQPDTVLSAHDIHTDLLPVKYIGSDARIMDDSFHTVGLYKHVPRRAATCIPEIDDEVSASLQAVLGDDVASWKEVTPFLDTMKVIARVSNRLFAGDRICREDGFLDAVTSYASLSMPLGTVLRMFPQFAYPVVGPIIRLPFRYFWRKSARYSIPIIQERLEGFARKRDNPAIAWEPPNDYLSWHITEAYAQNKSSELEAEILSHRLMAINFAAIHTTSLTLTNCMFDLFSGLSSAAQVESLREELVRVYREEGNQWTKAGLQRLYRVDSAVRESMRLSTFFTTALMRKVVATNGLEYTAEGYTLPKGAYVGIDVWSIRHDPDLYPYPLVYDALRFSRLREAYEALSTEEKSSSKGLEMKNLSLVTTGEGFFGFAHGRHACPGRFFIAIEMKLLLAHLLLKYDVEAPPQRPSSWWMGNTILPPMRAKLRIKKRDVPLC